MRELAANDENGFARGRVQENVGEGGLEDNDAGAGVEEKLDGNARVEVEAESEEERGAA